MEIGTITLKEALAVKNKMKTEEHVEGTRQTQERIGKILEKIYDQNLMYQTVMFRHFMGCWCAPKEQTHDGVILYLHGGGYCCGGINYAKGFASVLASRYNVRVFCIAYRLAPEYPFPSALEDAFCAYKYLRDFGYDGGDIALVGESAGGGLVNALCHKLYDEKEDMPAGVISISPWTDLTMSGDSFTKNEDCDVALTPGQVKFYAGIYADGCDLTNPYISPLYGDLRGFPPSLIIVGSDEMLLDDSVRFYKRLNAAGVYCELRIGEGLWHVYPLYGIKESKDDFERIHTFLNKVLNDRI